MPSNFDVGCALTAWNIPEDLGVVFGLLTELLELVNPKKLDVGEELHVVTHLSAGSG